MKKYSKKELTEISTKEFVLDILEEKKSKLKYRTPLAERIKETIKSVEVSDISNYERILVPVENVSISKTSVIVGLSNYDRSEFDSALKEFKNNLKTAVVEMVDAAEQIYYLSTSLNRAVAFVRGIYIEGSRLIIILKRMRCKGVKTAFNSGAKLIINGIKPPLKFNCLKIVPKDIYQEWKQKWF